LTYFFCPWLEFELDENNNEEQNEDANEKNTCMKLKCQTDEKGKPFRLHKNDALFLLWHPYAL
jgi:hypothetical protein